MYVDMLCFKTGNDTDQISSNAVRRVFFLETLLSTAGLFLTSREGFGDITEDGSHSLRNSETLHGM